MNLLPANLNSKTTLRKFRWWYRGVCPDGLKMSFQGSGWAVDCDAAISQIEKMMRVKYPTIKWQQFRDTEGEGDYRGVTFGPTVQMLKTTREFDL